jgi:hypothetical protein
MRKMIMLMLLSAWPCLAQISPGPQPSPVEPSTGPQQTAYAAQVQTAQPEPTITVPEGTRFELALANPIRTHVAHIGDSVRAVTTFPVTVGQDMAIPQGSFVEGSIARIGKRGSTRFDGLQIVFNRVIFSNGYTVTLAGWVLNAEAIAPTADSTEALATPAVIANNLPQSPSPTPTPPPLPQVGPSQGPFIAATLGGMAALTVVGILWRHRHPPETSDFDTGFQFEIVLQAPLTLDRARVAAALNGSNGD